jgi:hypothetical protein
MAPTHNGRTTEPDLRVPEKDRAANEFERSLTDTELVGLAVDVQSRVDLLIQQGAPMPMQEIENHHIIGLLECFVGPDESLRVKEWHLSWLDRKLDQAEAAMRVHFLQALGDPSDLPGFP